MKEAILQIPEPATPQQVKEFLGTIGYCRLWILGFAKKAWPLYEGSRENKNWTWTEPMKRAFQELRQALLEAPALALPDPSKPFRLFIDEKRGMGKGVDAAMGALEATNGLPIQTTGPGGCGVATLPPNHCCTALLVHDADKLTYGQRLLVYTPHAIEGILKQPLGKWISNARLIHYQALLLDTHGYTSRCPAS